MKLTKSQIKKLFSHLDPKGKVYLQKLVDKANNKVIKSKKNIADQYRQELLKNITPQELKFKKALKKLNIHFIEQHIVYTDKSFFILDFYIPKFKIAFEIDGSQHYTKEGKEKDNKRTKILEDKGIVNIYRFSNKLINKIKDSTIECKIKVILKRYLDI